MVSFSYYLVIKIDIFSYSIQLTHLSTNHNKSYHTMATKYVTEEAFQDGDEYQPFPEIKRRIGVQDTPFKVGSTGRPYTSEPGGNFWDMKHNQPILGWQDWGIPTAFESVVVNPTDIPKGFDASVFLKDSRGNRIIQLPYRTKNEVKIDLGINGRGKLGRFGTNGAVDPIVTRWKYDSDGNIVHTKNGEPVLQVIMIRRLDNGALALPGGMNQSSTVQETAARELLEETGGHPEDDSKKTGQQLAYLKTMLGLFHSRGNIIYQGYVPDPRNTTHAWMATTAINLHDNELHEGDGFFNRELCSGFDTREALKMDVSPTLLEDMDIYANHKKLIQLAYQFQVEKL
jgi:ADP-ribose pyrophosphatase YjhB (NUDIX family)